MTRSLYWLDVFTDRPFAGNPVAVVADADGMDDEQMQTIAGELGLSETVFVQGGAERLRIFTPEAELPLAGHPVVGTTVCLAQLGRIPSEGRHVFLTGVGETPVEMAGEVATMTQGPLDVGAEADPDRIAAMLGLGGDGLIGAPRAYSTSGVAQLFAQVRDRDALADVRADLASIAADTAIDGLLAWCEHGEELAQRFFMPRFGIDEDPATGSAAGALGALRVYEGAEPGHVVVRQGEEIGRPSEMQVTVGGAPGAPEPPRVGGRAALVLEGSLRV